MSSTDPPDTIAGNIAQWTATNARLTDAWADRAWTSEGITWGIFGVREQELGGPLGDVAGLDVVELGCGTAYLSAHLARRGARPVGVDPTPAQLATARRMQERHALAFPLVESGAERVPLPDAAFDLAVSEYGASLWADPALWVAEAARLLRPGGRLVFLTNSVLSILCSPDTGFVDESLHRPQFGGLGRIRWPDETGTEFHPSHGEWIRLLRAAGFTIEALIEVQAPTDAEDSSTWDYVSAAWARRWPAEEIWAARRLP